MSKKAFHGTEKFPEILRTGAVYCPALAFISHADEKTKEIMMGNCNKDYEKVMSDCARVARLKSKYPENKNLRDFVRQSFSEEAVADSLEELGAVGVEESLRSEYGELKRMAHVFLGEYRIAHNHARDDFLRNRFGAILEFEIPKEIIRKGNETGCILVRESVPLKYMKRVYVKLHNIGLGESLLRKQGYEGVEVKELVEPKDFEREE
ncbi:MAG: hypothetical protein U9Q06_00365 [Nanoarchaeota archaeon]|nr:hypothetical protein [Nanoarchaeota archaeon]